jgi:hypothetical protein
VFDDERTLAKKPDVETESGAYGEVVPTPTFPACVMTKSVRDDEPTANDGWPVVRFEVSTEKRAHGVVEATPSTLLALS